MVTNSWRGLVIALPLSIGDWLILTALATRVT